ncbi:MAG: PT domain-containing protein [Gemmatimonadota bacterium]|nr:PT domain-containing protein [Gemmatimonadota bacterium]
MRRNEEWRNRRRSNLPTYQPTNLPTYQPTDVPTQGATAIAATRRDSDRMSRRSMTSAGEWL